MKYLMTLFFIFQASYAFSIDFIDPKKIPTLPLETQFEEYKTRLSLDEWWDFGEDWEQRLAARENHLHLFLEKSQKNQFDEGVFLSDLLKLDLLLFKSDHFPNEGDALLEQSAKNFSQLKDLLLNHSDPFFRSRYFFYEASLEYGNLKFGEASLSLEKARAIFQNDPDNLNLMQINKYLFWAYILSSQPKNAREISAINRRLAEKFKLNAYWASYYYQMGFIETNEGEYAKSNDSLFRGLDWAKKGGYYDLWAHILTNIAFNKTSLEEHDSAVRYLVEAENLFIHKDVNDQSKASVISNLAAAYSILGDSKKEIEYYLKAIEIDEYNQDFKALIKRKSNLAMAYIKLKEFDKAFETLAQTKEIDKKFWLYDSYWFYEFASASYFFRKGDFSDAILHLEKALEISKKINSDKHLTEIYQLASDIYVQAKNPEKSLEFYKKFAELKLNGAEEKNKKLLYIKENEFKENQNQILVRENNLQAEELKATRYLKILLTISVVALIFMFFSLRNIRNKSQTIQFQKKKIDDILNNIDLGIATISKSEVIDNEHSAKILEIFQISHQEIVKLTYRDILAKTDISEDRSLVIQEAVQLCLGEDPLNFTLNSHLLNGEFEMSGHNKTFLQFEWYPMIRDNTVQKLMMVIKDISSIKQLEIQLMKKDLKQQISLELISHINHHPESVLQLFDRLKSIISVIEAGMKDDLKAVFFELHTLKGNARTLDLKSLATEIHKTEDSLKTLQGDGNNQKLQGIFQEKLALLKESLVLYQSHFELMAKGLPERGAVKFNVFGHAARVVDSIESMLNAGSIALDNFTLSCSYNQWERNLFNDTIDIITHALTNAADHGYIFPLRKGQSSMRSARFLVEVLAETDGIRVDISDNGYGIDRKVVEKIAEEKAFLPAIGQTIYDVLFESGVSTAGEVSLTSGRGVGLSAIRSIAEKWKGRASIHPRDSGGTTVSVKLRL